MLETIKRFEAHLRGLKGRSPHTVKAYGNDLRAFAAFLGRAKPRPTAANSEPGAAKAPERDEQGRAGTPDKAAIRAFLFELKNRGLANSSISRVLAALRAFHRWRLKEGDADFNPAAQVLGPKTLKKQALFLTEREMEKLLNPAPPEPASPD